MSVDFISKGIDVIKEAVECDNADAKEEALSLYKKGLEYLVAGIKYEKNKKSKAIIQAKIGEYFDRAEELTRQIDSAKNGKKKKMKPIGGDDDAGADAAKMKGALSSAIVQETPNVHWDDVAGLETAKSLLKEAVLLPIKFPQLFTGKRKPWKGILLFGPPGTGKSYLAKAVATEAGASTFFAVSSSDLVSKFQGESERLVRNLFEMAREKAPAIIFIDEIDSLCGSRSDGENDSARRIKTEFLVSMQGVGKHNDGVLVLGATNTPWDLDPAIRRRFEKRIYIPLPDYIARLRMFEIHIGDTPHSLEEHDFETLAQLTEGYSGSDISVVVRDALMEPLRFMSSSTHFRKVKQPKTTTFVWEPCPPTVKGATPMSLMDIDPDLIATPPITIDHFRSVLRNQKPSVSEQDLVRQVKWTNEFGQDG